MKTYVQITEMIETLVHYVSENDSYVVDDYYETRDSLVDVIRKNLIFLHEEECKKALAIMERERVAYLLRINE
jgi:hypothetical protein